MQLGDEVGIGKLHLRLAAEVVRDVDQSIGFASFAPRVMLNAADLPASGLVQEGSRIRYRLLVAGDAKQVAGLRTWLKGRLTLGEKMEDVRDARPEIRSALERAEHFLGLAALTAVVLAGVALALAARHFISRHLDGCAMMRCLGANQAQVLRIFLYQFLLLGFCAVLLGELLGYLSQAVLVDSIAVDARCRVAAARLDTGVAGGRQRHRAVAGFRVPAAVAIEKHFAAARDPPRTGRAASRRRPVVSVRRLPCCAVCSCGRPVR